MTSFEVLIGPSRALKIFIVALYVGTFIIWLWLPLHIGISWLFFLMIKIIGCMALGYHLHLTWKHIIARTHKNSVIRLGQNSNGQWLLQTKDGHCAKAILKGNSFKSEWIFILRFRLKQRSLNVIVPVDAVSSSEYRLLSTILNN